MSLLLSRIRGLVPLVLVASGSTAERQQVILQVPRAVDRAGVEQRLALEGCALGEELPQLGLLLVTLPYGADIEATTQRLAALHGVGFAEPNSTGEGGYIPSDPFFPVQWPLENTGQFGGRPGADIEAVRGWDLTRGSPSVIVAVLDSGLAANHPEFAGRVLPGFDFVNEDPDPVDDQGHGTLVAGILAANANNAFGLAGVDHNCTLLPVKILNRQNTGTTFDFAQGLVFAADAGAKAINMSLINYPTSASLRNALDYARDAGCVLIACAGNGGIGDADVSFPGRSALVISVGATTRFDSRALFSGTGAALDVVAPGEDVPATPRVLVSSWGSFSGCSAATPTPRVLRAQRWTSQPTAPATPTAT